MKHIVLLSGGLDSAVMLAEVLEKAQNTEVLALTVDYGQRHAAEIDCAQLIAQHYNVAHRVSRVDLRAVGNSALTDPSAELLERGRTVPEMIGIPASYVPARNSVMLSLAMAWAETVGASRICIGATADDYGGYPDCRPKYFAAFSHMATLASLSPIRVDAPLVTCTKQQVLARGIQLGVKFADTISCYDPSPAGACSTCDACVRRLRAFAEHGIVDPSLYRQKADTL